MKESTKCMAELLRVHREIEEANRKHLKDWEQGKGVKA